MAFVVEDGSGLTNSNSYVSVAEANAFHSDRGNSLWAGSDTIKQAALIRATDYIEQTYAGRWQGERYNDSQALDCPRDTIGVPDRLKQAVCILALEGISGKDLNPVEGRAIKRKKIDVIETEYMDDAKSGTTRPAIDGLLRGLLSGSILNGKVVRV